jgi:hypothetical protein
MATLPDTTENTRAFPGKLGTGVALHWIPRDPIAPSPRNATLLMFRLLLAASQCGLEMASSMPEFRCRSGSRDQTFSIQTVWAFTNVCAPK